MIMACLGIPRTSDVSESFLSSQSHLKFFRVRVRVRVMTWPSRVRVMTWPSRVTRTVESLRVIGLQARVNVESHEILHFFYNIFFP